MQNRLVISIILVNFILLTSIVPFSSSANNAPWWNDDWSFKQEIHIPIDTSSESAKYQPIDIRVEFNNSCWAKNEHEHSVRVIVYDNEMFKELEMQIYDLNYTDTIHINACSLVFLIPKEATGDERYCVYYDDDEKQGPDHPDHVAIDESYYRYEPIPGHPFESYYYKITEGDYVVYAVAQEGSFMDSGTAQQVTKLKSETETVMPKNGEQLASFDFTYWYLDRGKWVRSSTGEHLVSKEIFTDGNLMVKFGIVSRSSGEHFQTTNIYKYYHCPTHDKRINAHVKHEVLKFPVPRGDGIDVFYVTLNCGGFRSSSIEELNFGMIPPFLHVYGTDERVLSYNLGPCPESYWETVLGRKDDSDLGSLGWVSVDEGESGKAHSIIFSSNSVLQSGTDERDGIEVQAYESKDVQLPWLESNIAYIYLGRNTYEQDSGRDTEIPEDFIVEFDAEFFTTDHGGYRGVEQEAYMYQSLVTYQPESDGNMTGDDKQPGEFTLTVHPHLPPELSLELLISTLSGRKPHINAELYHNNNLIASGRCSRIDTKNGMKPDLRNFSLFRKIRFPRLIAGNYLVKIWLENSLFGNQRRFIGVQGVDVQEDMITHIFCRPEGTIHVSVYSQDETGVDGTEAYLLLDDMIIAVETSDEDGVVVLRVPCNHKDKYTFKVFYQGFVVYKEQIRLGYVRRILPLKKMIQFDVHDFTINVRTAQGVSPDFDIDMVLTSGEMEQPVLISAEKLSDGEYMFTDLYHANYSLIMRYKSFEVEETVCIPAKSSMDVNLYDLNILVEDTWNLPPDVSLDIALASSEMKKPVVIVAESLSDREYMFSDLYPGNYTLKLRYKSFTAEENVHIPDENIEILKLVFPAEYNMTATVFDARGNLLRDGKVLMMRGEIERECFIDEQGQVLFSLPPGVYVSRIYSDGRAIAERRINVNHKKTLEIVTAKEPIFPFIITVSTIIFILIAGFFMFKRKDFLSFLKIFAITLAFIAIVSPWWMLQGSSSEVETSTSIFLVPSEMVTLTRAPDVVAGELASLDETFVLLMNLLPVLMIFGCILIVVSMVLERLDRRILSFVSLLCGVGVLVVSIVVFIYGMSELVNVGVGSFLGSGNLDISIPGEGMFTSIFCSWGPSIGFYLHLVSTSIILLILILNIRKSYSHKD